MTTSNRNTSYPYNIDKITYLNLDDAYSVEIQSLIQRTQDQYKPNRLNMGVINEDCGLVVDREYFENQGLSDTELSQKYYTCCVGQATRWLNRQPGMKHLSKCEIFESCVRDCHTMGQDLDCDIKCMGYLPVIPGKGTFETADYCDAVIRDYWMRYKQQYDQGIKTCKEMSKSIAQGSEA
jgi:hypothetical protein